MANTNFTQRVGTVSGCVAAMKFLDLALATLRTTFRSRWDLRPPRLFVDLRFVAAKLPQITQIATTLEKRNLQFPGSTGCQPVVSGNCRSRSPHIGACARVDLDRFAFLNEKRNVDCLSGLQLCRFGDVARGIAP